MAVHVCLLLFGSPGQELEEGTALHGKQLRDLAAELQGRLHQAADTLDQLRAAGWTATLALHDVLFTHPAVTTRAEAERALAALGLDANAFMIVEELDEEDLE